jgi:hypothetical protein
MINKAKAIEKAVSKYHSIFPIPGKHSIEECFVCIRGEYFFLFKTKDKKRHIIKAEPGRPAGASVDINGEFFAMMYKVLSKPILVRSLFIKNTELSPPAGGASVDINIDFFSSIYKVLNKPILVRSLFIKNTELSPSADASGDTNGDFFASMYKVLNKPILVRSLFTKSS